MSPLAAPSQQCTMSVMACSDLFLTNRYKIASHWFSILAELNIHAKLMSDFQGIRVLRLWHVVGTTGGQKKTAQICGVCYIRD
jgi:hypothetical protein